MESQELLLRLFVDSDESVRAEAEISLRSRWRRDQQEEPERLRNLMDSGFLRLLESSDLEIQAAAIRVIDYIPAAAADILRILINRLDFDDDFTRKLVYQSLCPANPPRHAGTTEEAVRLAFSMDQRTFQDWVTAASDSDLQARTIAIYVLGQYGTPALPVIQGQMEAGDPALRLAGLAAMSWIGPDALLALRHAASTDDDLAVRLAAIYGLQFVGLKAVPFLDTILSDPDLEVREAALWSIFRLAFLDPSLRTRLIEAASDASSSMRWHACRTLGLLNRRDADTLKTLQMTSEDDDDSEVKSIASMSLKMLSEQNIIGE